MKKAPPPSIFTCVTGSAIFTKTNVDITPITPPLWKCEYCITSNLMEEPKCVTCGAPRRLEENFLVKMY